MATDLGSSAPVRRGCYIQCYYASRALCECACGGENHQLGYHSVNSREVALPDGRPYDGADAEGDLRPGYARPIVIGSQQVLFTSISGEIAPASSPPPPTPPGAGRDHAAAAAPAAGETDRGSLSEAPTGGYEPTEEERSRLEAIERAQAEDPVARGLAEAPITTRHAMGRVSLNYVERVQLQDGTIAYLKPVAGVDTHANSDNPHPSRMYGVTPHEEMIHEAAAYQFAKALGDEYAELVPPVALVADDQHGLAALIVHCNGQDGFAVRQWATEASPDQVHRAAFFDMLIGNADRHAGNLLVDGTNRDRESRRALALIDHGMAFNAPPGLINQSRLVQARVARGDAALDEREIKILDRLETSPDLLGIGPIIGHERAEAMRERIRIMRVGGNQVVQPRVPPIFW